MEPRWSSSRKNGTVHFKCECARQSRNKTDPVACQLAGHWMNEVFDFLSTLSDLLGSHPCAENCSRIYSMQLSEIHYV